MSVATQEPQTGLKPQTVELGGVPVTRFILGGNPFSGGGYPLDASDPCM